jgi:(E)-4-hydroxy-3-methylbut-2-enyl-diphosphate synthase
LRLGGREAVVIQSMTSTPTADTQATLEQIRALEAVGCELVRVAVPDSKAAEVLPELVKGSPLPLVADIHFQSELALAAIEAGVAKVRINPGNLGREAARAVAAAAGRAGIAMRIGVNAGSIPEKERQGSNTAEEMAALMVAKVLEYAEDMEAAGCPNLVLSVKSSDTACMQAAYTRLAQRTHWPLHLGLTEAGSALAGTVRSTLALAPLLRAGLGDTLRVSLTGDPVNEILVAQQILKALGIRRQGVEIIACPTCGRTAAELERILLDLERALAREQRSLVIAVMGCAVNGPGEARHADLGLAGVPDGSFVLFAKGRPLRRVAAQDAVRSICEAVAALPPAEKG